MNARRSLLGAGAAALAALAALASGALAFRLESNLGVHPTTPVNPRSPVFTRFIHWDVREFPNCTVPYSINSAGTADSSATGGFTGHVNAANSWTAVASVLSLARQANSAIVVAAQDNVNLWGWDGGNAANTAFWGAPLSGILALTCVWTQAATGRMLESDIIYNDRDWQWNNTGDNFSNVTSANAAPFALADMQTLQIRVDGGAVQTVTFNAANFADITMATAAEVQTEMVNQLGGLWVIVTGGGNIRIVSNTFNGTGTIQVVGGTGAGAFGFPGGALLTRIVDIETVAVHEIGHFIGVAHSSDNGAEPNATYSDAVMYAFAPALGTKRALTADDQAAMRFLYTPDYGDAPEDAPDMYQTITRTGTNGRVLNGVQLVLPDNGPGHLFNDFTVDSLKMEWLGDEMDGSVTECEALLIDADQFDDGVSFAMPMTRGVENEVVVYIRYKDASRYDSSNPQRTLNMNGYFDFDSDDTFTLADREIWWRGDPTNGTLAASGTWTSATFSAGLIELHFEVVPSLASEAGKWSRFRLDVGEDEGATNNWNGDLARALAIAQFGEVEDYRYALQDPPVQIALPYMDAEATVGSVSVSWTFPAGVADVEEVRVYRSEEGSGFEARIAAVPVGDGESPGRYVDTDVRPGGIYVYRLGLFDGTEEVSGPSERIVVPLGELALYGVAPNPTSDGGTIGFYLPRGGTARLALYTVSGRRAAWLLDERLEPGPHEVSWDGRGAGGTSLAPGVYLLRLEVEGEARVSRVVLSP